MNDDVEIERKEETLVPVDHPGRRPVSRFPRAAISLWLISKLLSISIAEEGRVLRDAIFGIERERGCSRRMGGRGVRCVWWLVVGMLYLSNAVD